MRKGAFLTLSFYMLVSIILLLLGKHELIFNSFALSLLFGILWQIFTLTKIGTAFLNRTDLIANILLGKKKEVTSE
ncbi:hypothetical protein SDC9_192849 [bioreactor metagenome]|uniref:Uncharacterized protein n=1 Tax=bioreactor metagenome TaxID=1076179 RepID=A0A645I3D0_9ZZZZ